MSKSKTESKSKQMFWGRTAPSNVRKRIAKKQDNKCANCPDSEVRKKYMNGYECNYWKNNNGDFGSDFEIDHKIEVQCGGSNHEQNLHALCTLCHKIKTLIYGHAPQKYYPTNSQNKLKKEWYKGKKTITVENDIKREKEKVDATTNKIINKEILIKVDDDIDQLLDDEMKKEQANKTKEYMYQVIDGCHANWSESETESESDDNYYADL